MKHLSLADIKALEPAPLAVPGVPTPQVFPPKIKTEWLRLLRHTIPTNSVYMNYENTMGEGHLVSCCALGGLMSAVGLPNMCGVKQALFNKFPEWAPYLQRVEDIHMRNPCVYDGREDAIAYIETHF